MEIRIKESVRTSYGTALCAGAFEEEKELSSGIFTLTETQYGEKKIKTLLAGGIETPVVNRRGGCVRRMLEEMHAYGAENGCVYVWNANTGSLRETLRTDEKRIDGVCFSPDGCYILAYCHRLLPGDNYGSTSLHIWGPPTWLI